MRKIFNRKSNLCRKYTKIGTTYSLINTKEAASVISGDGLFLYSSLRIDSGGLGWNNLTGISTCSTVTASATIHVDGGLPVIGAIT